MSHLPVAEEIARTRSGMGRLSYGMILQDLAIIALVYYLALNFRYQGNIVDGAGIGTDFLIFLALAVPVHVGFNHYFGAYRLVPRFIGLAGALRIWIAAAASGALLLAIDFAWPGSTRLVPLSVVAAGAIGVAIGMITLRFAPRICRAVGDRRSATSQRMLVVGAGQGADMLIREIRRTRGLGVKIVGVIDDDPMLRGMDVQGCRVLGAIEDTPRLVEQLGVDHVVIAIPSATPEQLARIHKLCKSAKVPIKTMPSLSDLVSGTASVADIRDIDVSDLISRPKVQTDLTAIADYLCDKSILVTGAGGSIGSELCRQIARFHPERLILVDRAESALYHLHEKLQSLDFNQYALCVNDIMHEGKMDQLFAKHRPELVFHAAAYKHVPLMEINPDEAVLNNIRGSMIVAEAAARHDVKRFVNVSTDKAVEPSSVMGATKRAVELLMCTMGRRYPRTHFASVRFGNVLGSQGSVVPVFQKQIQDGGPVVVTHPSIERYFMLLEEAVQLMLQAAAMAEEQELDGGPEEASMFVLDMGQQIPIIDIAQKMIDLLWPNGGNGLGVEFSGLRPGEKLSEKLAWADEITLPTAHPMVFRVASTASAASTDGRGKVFGRRLSRLLELAEAHEERDVLIKALAACVEGYRPIEHVTVQEWQENFFDFDEDLARQAV